MVPIPSYPPPGGSFAPPPLPPRKQYLWVMLAGGLAVGIAIALFIGLALRGSRTVAQSVVRVVLQDKSGTGFFVAGPDAQAYVVTAQHVVDDGDPIRIERTVQGSGGSHWTEAYPDTEVVAFDSDADLAVIRLKGVRADHFTSLRLAKQSSADESILSYGFPASSLSSQSGMVSKPGKVLSLVKFPVVDHLTGEIVRNDAVDGLLISSEIEPGFSGGPTCNEKGEVVGVNVTKDNVHRAQNGAVDVAAVRALLEKVVPTAQATDPSTDDVKQLLTRVQSDYLMLPVDRRWQTREEEFVSASDFPRTRDMLTAMRRLEADTSRDKTTKLSGQATLGLVLSRLPGRPLETYTDRRTRKELDDCEVREQTLRQFFHLLPKTDGDADVLGDGPSGRCLAVAFRPLVWDLAALSLHWDGKERGITVGKVEPVDPSHHVYRASARFDGLDYVVDVWIAADGGRLRLKLFDNEGRPAGLSLAQTEPASAFSGTWHRSEPRTTHDFGRGVDADADTDETLVVSIGTDGSANVTHQVRKHVYFTGRVRASCGGATVDLGIEQSFHGVLQDASVVGYRKQPARPIGTDMGRCSSLFTYAPDQEAVFKRVGDKLMMYRTDGVVFPEAAEFAR